ncbi:hypothetical protein AZ887_11285 [Staphylococcus epidermidis]|nr:hypothetical protein AZ887_11285 [Staphylococcus epidermidis]
MHAYGGMHVFGRSRWLGDVVQRQDVTGVGKACCYVFFDSWQKTAYVIMASLVGSGMCLRDRI